MRIASKSQAGKKLGLLSSLNPRLAPDRRSYSLGSSPPGLRDCRGACRWQGTYQHLRIRSSNARSSLGETEERLALEGAGSWPFQAACYFENEWPSLQGAYTEAWRCRILRLGFVTQY